VLLLLAIGSVFSLGPYNVDPLSVTVGGLSSGGYFAVQFQVAFSGSISGAAIFAGGPYYCAQDSLSNALVYCMGSLTPTTATLVSQAKSFASKGYIDPVVNMKSQAAYIFSGTNDFTVKQDVVKTLVAFYAAFSLANLTTNFGMAAGHGYPTVSYGVSCSSTMSPYLTKCNYDGAGASLEKLYGSLKPMGQAKDSNIIEFAQSAFTKVAPSSISMGPNGYVYVPTSCQNKELCKLHVQFHGCQQTIGDIGKIYYTETGLNDWAETNNIIVLYPQVQDTFLSNPNGCWDWWGYTSSSYAWKTGSQMVAVKAMIDAIIGK